MFGGPTGWRTLETEDELSFVRLLRACSPAVVARVAWLMLKELEDNPAARSSADQLRVREDITRLGRILDEGGNFERGQSPEDAGAAVKELARQARGNQAWREENPPEGWAEHNPDPTG
jgi:hypothetical protein